MNEYKCCSKIEVLERQIAKIAIDKSKHAGSVEDLWLQKINKYGVSEESILIKQVISIVNDLEEIKFSILKSLEKGHLKDVFHEIFFLEEEQVPENNEILIHFMSNGEIMNRNNIIVDNIFLYKITIDITKSNEKSKSKLSKNIYVEIIGQKCKSITETELNSLVKCEIYGPTIQTPKDVMLVNI